MEPGRYSKAIAIALVSLLPGALSAATEVSGTLRKGGGWTAAGSPYTVTADLTLPAGETLVIGPGVTVAFRPDGSLVVQGVLDVRGTAEAKVKFGRADPETAWAGVAVYGAAAAVILSHFELDGGTEAKCGLPDFPEDYPSVLKIVNGARARIENSRFQNLKAVIDIGGGGELLISDTLIENSKEAIHSNATYCLIERVTIRGVTGYSDCVDFDYDSTPPSVIRDCLFDGNEEDDCIDTAKANCLIENTVIRNIHGGKCLSLEGKSTPIVRNLLILDSHWGIVSKDGCTPDVRHVTIAGCDVAVNCFEKNAGHGGGMGSGDSMILWGNDAAVQLDALSSFAITNSIVQGSFPGDGNIDADPLFADAAAGDYHLTAASPAVGAGTDGSDMGCFPYEGPPPVEFLRGDGNGDRFVDLSDAVAILFYLYAGAPAGPCPDALDADDSGIIDVSDPVRVLGYLFLDAEPPASPFPAIGPDPSDDELECASAGGPSS
jgi:hypothetical protein